MGIGAVSAYSQMSNLQSSYKVNSIYGNPKSLEPVDKIGKEKFSGNPFAVVSEKDAFDEEEAKRIKEQQSKPFDYGAAMTKLSQGTRFSADTIPVVDMLTGTV